MLIYLVFIYFMKKTIFAIYVTTLTLLKKADFCHTYNINKKYSIYETRKYF